MVPLKKKKEKLKPKYWEERHEKEIQKSPVTGTSLRSQEYGSWDQDKGEKSSPANILGMYWVQVASPFEYFKK